MKSFIEEIILEYKATAVKAVVESEEFKKLSQRYSLIRLSIFLLSIPVLYFIIKTNIYFFFIFLIVAIALFIWAVLKQQKYDKLYVEKQSLIAINNNEISVIETQQNLYYNGRAYSIPNHFYTEDLDIFGPHSIFALINRSRTYYGNQMLKNSFLEKSSKEMIEERQSAIKEISKEKEWRQEVSTSLFQLEDLEHYDIASAIDNQMEMDLSFAEGFILNVYRKSLPLMWILVAALYYYNSSLANSIASFVFIGNLIYVGKFTKKISKIQAKLANTSTSLKQYIEVLKIIFTKKWTSTLLKAKTEEFDTNAGSFPVNSLARLSSIIDKLDYRLNILVAIVGNGLFIMDLGTVYKLSQWKKENDEELDKLFRHIGFIEEMISCATFAFNNPQYTYPEITEVFLEVEAKNVEHPLILVQQNVSNDFKIDPTDKVFIVTGSNMSGKSTLLRTLGLNMILGYTGTKVAATKMKFPIVQIVTYMRIKDALEENVSTFKAELNRIEMILNLLQKEGDTFILIDEMLRGTNSKDKLYGSIGITKKLLNSKAYSMIATHDIKLAELGLSDKRIANYYFDIDYANGELVFDYKVKEGICENFNASFLLNQLGIDTNVSA